MSAEPAPESEIEPNREPPAAPPRRLTRASVGRGLALAGALALFGWVLSQLKFDELGHLFHTRGPLLLLVFVPYVGMALLDSLGWSVLLELVGQRVRLRSLLRIRLLSDAVLVSAPAGTFMSEAIKPLALKRAAEVPPATTVATLTARLWAISFIHLLQLLSGAAFGWSVFAAVNGASEGVPVGSLAVVVAVVMLGTLTSAEYAIIARGDFAEKLLGWLRTILPGGVALWLESKRQGFLETDAGFRAMLAQKGKALRALAYFGGVGVLEAGELWLVAELAGVPIGLGAAAAVESMALFVRAVVFFAPAGLGFQDAGYVGFLTALYGPEAAPAAAAVVLLKRSRELVWGAIGFGVHMATRNPELPAAVDAPLAEATEDHPLPRELADVAERGEV